MSGLDDLLGGLLGGSTGGAVAGGALGSVLGKLGGGGGSSPLVKLLMPAMIGLLAGGGLKKLLGKFQASGLSSQADSWVGKGENQPVTGDQVRKALGDDEIAKLAEKLGLSHDETAQAVAEVLPHVVDHVTPDGEVPADHEVAGHLGKLEELLGKA